MAKVREKKYIVLSGGFEWCYYSWKGYLDNNPNVLFFEDGLPIRIHNPKLRFLWKYIFWKLGTNKKTYKLHKWLWYRRIIKNIGINQIDTFILITYDRNVLLTDLMFYDFIKKNYRNVTLVYLFSNIIDITAAKKMGIVEKLNNYFDVVFAFDKNDAEKYGFYYSPLIYTYYSKIDNSLSNTIDLFYIGQAKDKNRYNLLVNIYEQAIKEGLKCDFNIVGVPKDLQKHSDGIHYNHTMSYLEVLHHIKSSRCLVDVIQQGSSGLTIKTCESVIYDKKLISTNISIVKEPFYNTDNILIVQDSVIPCLKDFLNRSMHFYHPQDKKLFSPDTLFALIDSIRNNGIN